MLTKNLTRCGLVLLAALSLPACDLLEVDNPNNIVEESLANVQAAAAVVNGAEATLARGHGQIMPVYSTLSDELFWIGSRDAWLSLDQGNMNDPANEFTDAAFPEVNEGRWMSDLAVSSLEGFLADDPSNATLKAELARANLLAGISYMFIGTMFEDFVFSNKKEPGTPVGASNMASVLQSSIGYLDAAVANSSGDLNLAATAVRARAKWELAAWGKQNSPSPSSPLVSDAGADADALAAIAAAGGVTADWRHQFTYAASQVANDAASWVNDRSEMQWGERYVTNGKPDAINDITGVALMDPVDGVDAPYVQQFIIDEFSAGTNYSPLTVVSTRRMHLQLAESALAGGDATGFATHVNHVRAMDGLTPYAGGDDMNMLKYMRMANLIMEGSRLGDLYRFGEQSDNWLSSSDAVAGPGTFLPITNIEILSNPNIG